MVLIFLIFAFGSYENADVRFDISIRSGNGLSIKVFDRGQSVFDHNVDTKLQNPIDTATCFLKRIEDGYLLEYEGEDQSSIELLINDKGDIIIPKAQNTNYQQSKSWGFRTSGAVINRGEAAFAGFYTKCHEMHNFGVLKTKYFEMLQPYIFNSGIIHAGDNSDDTAWTTYGQYLPLIDQKTRPAYTAGLFDDYGVTLIEGTLKLMHLTHRVHRLAQITKSLQLENSSIDNQGDYTIDETITGDAPIIENHGHLQVGFLDSTTLQVGSWINCSSIHVSRPSDLWAKQDLNNEGIISGDSSLKVGSQRAPKRFGILQAASGQLGIQVTNQMTAEEMQQAYDKALFLSMQKIKVDVVCHTDHLLNTITDHYTVDQFGNRTYSHRTETGYIFQHRTTDCKQKEIDPNSAEVPPEIAKFLQQQKKRLEEFKKQLDQLKEKLQNAKYAGDTFGRALREYLKTLGLEDKDIDAIVGDRTPKNAFRELYQQQMMQQDLVSTFGRLAGMTPQVTFNPIQWAQVHVGDIFEALLQSGDWLAKLGRRSAHPVVSGISQGYNAIRNAQRTQQALNKAQILLSKRQSGKDKGLPIVRGNSDQQFVQPARVQNVTKAESVVWRNLKVYRKEIKTNGESGKKERLYEWDHRHNDIEVYGPSGREHFGSMHPVSGEIYKPPVPGRDIVSKLR